MKKHFQFCLVILLLVVPNINSLQINSRKVVYAVNCGSSSDTTSDQGFRYNQDQGYSPESKVSDYRQSQEASSAQIKYTSDPIVYQLERHSDNTFYYDIPVSNNGKYVLILQFCENYFQDKGKRVFNVNLGDKLAIKNVDIAGKVGKFAAYDQYIEFELKDGLVYHDQQFAQKAYNPQTRQLRVFFEKIGIDNPLVNGIILFQGTLQETDYNTIEQQKEQWEKRQVEEKRRKEEERIKKEEARLKKREKFKIRNDQLDESEDDIEEVDMSMIVQKSKFENLLKGPLGLVGVVGFFVILYVLLTKIQGGNKIKYN